MADDEDAVVLLSAVECNENVETEPQCYVIVTDEPHSLNAQDNGSENNPHLCSELTIEDGSTVMLTDQLTISPPDASEDRILLVRSTIVLIRTIKGKSYQLIKYLTILLLSASLSLGIFIIVDDHGRSLTSKDDFIFLQNLYKQGKKFLEQHETHRVYHNNYDQTENRYYFEEDHESANDVPDKIILLPKIVAQSVISVIDFYGIVAVLCGHFYSVRDLVAFMSFLNLYLLLDYSQQYTPVRLVLESFAMMALTSFAQKINPLHSKPLFPCSCNPDQFIVVLLNTLLPCSCCTCCSCENTDPRFSSQQKRLESFKLGTSAAILISFGGSIYTFYSCYTQVDRNSTAVYITAIVMNSIVSIYGFVATLCESYRSLNGHFSISLACGAIIIILALRLTPTAAWLLLPLATSAFSVYILTCLMRVFYSVKDCKPYAACKIFILFWLISTIPLAPAFITVTYLHYTGDDQEKIPAYTLCGLALILLIIQCLLLYGTLAEKYVLLDKVIHTFVSLALVSVGAGLLVKFLIFPDTVIQVWVYVVSCVLATVPIFPFFKYYVIEVKLFNDVMSEAEIWFVHRQARKFFDAIQISQTVGNVCSAGLHVS